MLTRELDWDEELQADPVLEHMKRLGLPLTRASYLEFNYPDGVPCPLPAELAASVPGWLRDASESLHGEYVSETNAKGKGYHADHGKAYT